MNDSRQPVATARVEPSTRQAAWLKLALACLMLAGIWLYLLPWLATCPPLAEHIARMEREKIAVDAMFYTELEWEAPDGAVWR